MNSFDFIVTIALGSTPATILLTKKVALAEELTAFMVLIGMQYLMTFLSVRSAVFKRIIKAEPEMLYYNGDFIREAMKRSECEFVKKKTSLMSGGFVYVFVFFLFTTP